MIGHDGHPEAEGTMGQAEPGMYLVETEEDVAKLEVPDPDQLAYVTQTTLSIDDCARIIAALRRASRAIVGPKKDDICYATQNRQDAVKFMAPRCDVVIVVGSPNSSNSNRLREVAEQLRAPAYLVDKAGELDPEWLEGKPRVGVTAGASAPEVLVQEVVERLRSLGAKRVRQLEGVEENVVLPDAPGAGRLDSDRSLRYHLKRWNFRALRAKHSPISCGRTALRRRTSGSRSRTCSSSASSTSPRSRSSPG